MRYRTGFRVLLLASACLGGCGQLLGYLTAESPPFTARGTWHGLTAPVLLEGVETGQEVMGMRLIVSEGPSLRQRNAAAPVSTVGWTVILADERKQVLPWTDPTPDARPVSVTGYWNSHDTHVRRKGEAMILSEVTPPQVPDLYNVIITESVQANQP